MKKSSILLFFLLYSIKPYLAEKPALAIIKSEIKGTTDQQSAELIWSEILLEFTKSELFSNVTLVEISSLEPILNDDRECSRNLRKATRLFLEAKEFYAGIEFQKAIENFKAAVVAFNSSLSCMEDNSSFILSYIYLGLSYFAKDLKTEAISSFKTALKINPHFSLSISDFSPSIVMEFDKIKSEIQKQQVATLNITTEPASVKVFLNGSPAEKTIKSIIPGDHFVLIKGEGFIVESKLINLIEGETKSIEIKLAKLSNRLNEVLAIQDGKNNSLQKKKELLSESAKRLNCDILFISEIEWIDENKIKIKSELFDSRNVVLSKTYKDKIKIGQNNIFNEMVNNLVAFLGSDELMVKDKKNKNLDYKDDTNKSASLDRKFSMEESKPFYRSPWFWSGTTLTILAGGAVAYYFLLYNKDIVESLPENGTIVINFD